MRIGKSFWWVLALLALSIIAATIPTLQGNTIYIRLIFTWSLIIVIGWVWAFLSVQGIDVYRHSRTLRHNVGQLFVERFDVINRSRLTKVWLKISDDCDLPGSDGSRILSNIGGKQSRSYSSQTLLRYRGMFTLGPTTISSGDIFGLFTFTRQLPSQTRLIVLPYMVSLSHYPAPFGVLPGGRALRLKTTEVTPFSAGVREYMPGDPLRRIHWPTTARKQQLIVKEFEQDPLAEIWIFLDAREDVQSVLDENAITPKDPGSFFWMSLRPKFELPPSTVEYSISAAASIAKYYIDQKREVGLSVYGQTHTMLPAERGERQMGKILETLALLKTEGAMPLHVLVGSQINSLVRGSTVVLITASVDQEVVFTAGEILLRGMLPVVVLLDAASFGGNKGSDELEAELIQGGFIVTRIKFGEDLATALERKQMRLPDRQISWNKAMISKG